MFRIWGKLWKENRLLQDQVITMTDDRMSRTDMVLDSLEQLCIQFDLSKPIWLDANIREFQQHDRTRFRQDNFIEIIDFDYLEIEVIEE